MEKSVSPKTKDDSAIVSETGHDAGIEVSQDEAVKVVIYSVLLFY